jgi:dienelactone hydrolase
MRNQGDRSSHGGTMCSRLAALAAVLSVLSGCMATTSSGLLINTTASNGAVEQIPATVSKPDGPGPFPAVVIMHDCSGLGFRSSGSPARWARELVDHGYVVIIPDSFTTRGHPGGVCTDPSPSRNEVAPYQRVRDAYAALVYARSLSYVDGRRVGLMGGSHGGTTTLAAIAAPESAREPHARERNNGFAAAVGLYPGCAPMPGTRSGPSSALYKPVAPLLILIGEKDDWTPAEPCRKLTEAARQSGYPVAIKVYPGAYHSFDSPNPVRYVTGRVNANSPTGRGATTGGDPKAWADSIREVLSFFARHLGDKTK